ncbi:hypothetical protein SAMN05444679_1121, partial [Variovorax sp. CF079]
MNFARHVRRSPDGTAPAAPCFAPFIPATGTRFRLRRVAAFIGMAVSACAAWAAWAVEPFTVRDIRVEGLQRVEPGTIFASLP